jgi:hypothetical protein
MTQEALKLALEYLESRGLAWNVQIALREALREHAMREVQRLGQEIEQEPVTTLEDLEQEIYENTRQFVSHDVMEWMLKRYYTTPPQRTWVGLTDEEIDDLWESTASYYNTHDFARAIEAKLKEKNT